MFSFTPLFSLRCYLYHLGLALLLTMATCSATMKKVQSTESEFSVVSEMAEGSLAPFPYIKKMFLSNPKELTKQLNYDALKIIIQEKRYVSLALIQDILALPKHDRESTQAIRKLQSNLKRDFKRIFEEKDNPLNHKTTTFCLGVGSCACGTISIGLGVYSCIQCCHIPLTYILGNIVSGFISLCTGAFTKDRYHVQVELEKIRRQIKKIEEEEEL